MNTTSNKKVPVKPQSRNRFLRSLDRFRRDDRGISLVEFGLVAPFLLVTWLGLVAMLDTENTTTKVSKVTSTVADIIAQAPNANSEFITAAFDAGKAMLGNVSNQDLKIYVAGLRVDADQSVEVVWICGRRFSEEEMEDATENLDLPSELKEAPGFIIASYANYKHTPIYGDKFTGEHTYEYNHYFVPRHSLETLNDGCGA